MQYFMYLSEILYFIVILLGYRTQISRSLKVIRLVSETEEILCRCMWQLQTSEYRLSSGFYMNPLRSFMSEVTRVMFMQYVSGPSHRTDMRYPNLPSESLVAPRSRQSSHLVV